MKTKTKQEPMYIFYICYYSWRKPLKKKKMLALLCFIYAVLYVYLH